MNETNLIPLGFLAFSGIVLLSIYLERKIEKKRKETIKKKRLSIMGVGNTVNQYHHEDFKNQDNYNKENPDSNSTNNLHEIDKENRKTGLKIPGYYEEVLLKEKTNNGAFAKLSSLEEIDL